MTRHLLLKNPQIIPLACLALACLALQHGQTFHSQNSKYLPLCGIHSLSIVSAHSQATRVIEEPQIHFTSFIPYVHLIFFTPFFCIMDDPNINGIKHSYVNLFKNLSCQFVKHFPKLLYISYTSNQSVPTLLVQKIDKQWFEFKHTKHICTSRFWE